MKSFEITKKVRKLAETNDKADTWQRNYSMHPLEAKQVDTRATYILPNIAS